MKKWRFSEVEIVGIFQELEAGLATNEICRRHDMSPATFYCWKPKFGGLEMSDVAKIKGL